MDEPETLGTYLKQARETKRISLKDVAKNTRVRENLLQAVEDDRYDLLPSPTFVKGFLTAYARYIGLDPQETIARYQSTLKKKDAPPTPEARPKNAIRAP
jgi:cytoskeleton protein RodZ